MIPYDAKEEKQLERQKIWSIKNFFGQGSKIGRYEEARRSAPSNLIKVREGKQISQMPTVAEEEEDMELRES